MPAAASWCADVRRARKPTRSPPRRPARAAGFTLLEILIALAIVSVALAAVMRTTGMLTTNNGVLR